MVPIGQVAQHLDINGLLFLDRVSDAELPFDMAFTLVLALALALARFTTIASCVVHGGRMGGK